MNPRRNVPLSITVGIVLVIVVYIMTNVAYFVVLTKDQVLSSDAVAVTFADEAFHFPALTKIIPVLVGISVFGCFSGNYITNGEQRFQSASATPETRDAVTKYVRLIDTNLSRVSPRNSAHQLPQRRILNAKRESFHIWNEELLIREILRLCFRANLSERSTGRSSMDATGPGSHEQRNPGSIDTLAVVVGCHFLVSGDYRSTYRITTLHRMSR